MRRLEIGRFIVIGLLAFSRVALGVDCAAVPGNQLTDNCGFETGNPPSGWTLGEGDSFTQNTSVFRSGAASGQIDAASSLGSSASIRSSCLPITPGAPFGFGAFLRLISGSPGGVSCRSSLSWFSSTSCDAFVGGWQGSLVVPTTDAWVTSTGVNIATASFGQLTLQCTSNADFVIAVDDATFGLGLLPVELTAFTVE